MAGEEATNAVPLMVRYIVVGVGAIGGTVAGKLWATGCNVVGCARGEHLRVIQSKGLHLRTPDEDLVASFPAFASPGAVEPPLSSEDVVIIATKAQAAEAILVDLAAAAAARQAEPAVVCCTNGVSVERTALRLFARVYGVMVEMPGTHLHPGETFCHRAAPHGFLPVGRYPSGTDELCEQIAADFVVAGLVGGSMPDIMRLKHRKLLGNLANALEALFGVGATGSEASKLAEIRKRISAEATACLGAAGMDVISAEEYSTRRPSGLNASVQTERDLTKPVGPLNKPGNSTVQSILRGGSAETDHLNGEIVLLGRLFGIPTPVNEAVQRAMAVVAAAQEGALGTMQPSDVLAMAAL